MEVNKPAHRSERAYKGDFYFGNLMWRKKRIQLLHGPDSCHDPDTNI